MRPCIVRSREVRGSFTESGGVSLWLKCVELSETLRVKGSPAPYLMPLMGAAPLLQSGLACASSGFVLLRDAPRRMRVPRFGATITVLYIRENCVISPAIWRKLTPTPKWPVSDVVAKNVAPPSLAVKVGERSEGIRVARLGDWDIGWTDRMQCSSSSALYLIISWSNGTATIRSTLSRWRYVRWSCRLGFCQFAD